MLTTRGAVIMAPGGPWEVVELELDEPRAAEVRVRFAASGLCHSDEHTRAGATPSRYPLVGGHEGAGIVEAVGPGVTRVAVGDRVVCSFVPACGVCRYCSTGRQFLCDDGKNAATGELPSGGFRFHRDGIDFGGMCVLGTFSERAVISEHSCVLIPGDIPLELAALLACGVPTGWGAAVYAAQVRPGQTVVVFGVGGVGSNALQGARHAGAKYVVAVDPEPAKHKAALTFGATHVFAEASEALEFVRTVTWGQLADHAIITVGNLHSDVVDEAMQTMGKGGQVTIVSVGDLMGEKHLQMSVGPLIAYTRRIRGTLFGDCNPLFDIPRLIGLYESGDLLLDELITNRYSLDEINRGYEDMLSGRNIRGVVIHDAPSAP